MTRAADRRPAPGRARSPRATRTGSVPASAPTTASTRSTSPATPSASTTRPPGREQTLPHGSPPAPAAPPGRRGRRRPRRARGRPGARRARATRWCVLEAADVPGGQVRLAAAAARRRDLIGIVDWRVAGGQALRRRVPLRRLRRRRRPCSPSGPTWSSSPPAACRTRRSSTRARTWSPTPGTCWPARSTRRAACCVYDDNGAEPALDAAELLAGRGAAVEFVTPERTLGPDVGSMNSPAYLQAFAEHDVTVTLGSAARPPCVAPRATGCVARWAATTPTPRSSGASTRSSWSTARCRTTSSTSTWCRTPPTLGAVDHAALLAVRPQTLAATRRPASSSSASATPSPAATSTPPCYDALRLCSAI